MIRTDRMLFAKKKVSINLPNSLWVWDDALEISIASVPDQLVLMTNNSFLECLFAV